MSPRLSLTDGLRYTPFARHSVWCPTFPDVMSMLSGEDGIVLTFDLRVFDKGSVLLTTPGPTGIKGMALNPLDPNYFFICGDSPNLHLYDARKVDIPATR